MRRLAVVAWLAWAGGPGCALRGDQSAPEPATTSVAQEGGGGQRADAPKPADAPAPPAAPGAKAAARADEALAASEPPSDGEHRRGAEAATPAAARAWFPETFLFEPLLVTDAHGDATVSARVPDRLTSWRVLALAHSRGGAQAGAVARFEGTLPVYVDPVAPSFLTAGDDVVLPVQLVNTTSAPLSRPLRVEAEGAASLRVDRVVDLPAGGASVVAVALRAARPGRIALRATLGADDTVLRSIPVRPAGRPVVLALRGTLAAPRTVELVGPADLDRASARARLLVYPGALALLRAELGACLGRAGPAEDGYALLLAGRAARLLGALGDRAEPAALRALAIVAGQRVIRDGRAPDAATATLLVEAAAAHPDAPVLARLAERLAAGLATAQRPDGSFAGEDGWTLQRVLVAAADGAAALRAAAAGSPRGGQRATAAAVRASGLFERHAARVQDGYTAAAILASGAAPAGLVEALRARVRAKVVTADDGARALPVERGVVRADGQTPSTVEATALAALALEGDPAAPWRADLGATLLAGYAPDAGWGDGRANLTCLRAALALFREPVPTDVRITLELDGQVITQGLLDASKRREVLTLEGAAPGAAGAHRWTVRAEPPVPGLGYALSLEAWVPWRSEPADAALGLAVRTPSMAEVGRAVEVRLEAAAPAGVPLRLRHLLPAGVQVDRAGLDALQAAGLLRGASVEEGAVTLELAPLAPGARFEARYRVIPTLAGTLHAGASSLEIVGRPDASVHVPSPPWRVR